MKLQLLAYFALANMCWANTTAQSYESLVDEYNRRVLAHNKDKAELIRIHDLREKTNTELTRAEEEKNLLKDSPAVILRAKAKYLENKLGEKIYCEGLGALVLGSFVGCIILDARYNRIAAA